MYYLIEPERKLNVKKVIIVTLIFVCIISVTTILGIKSARKKCGDECLASVQELVNKIEEEEAIKKAEEQAKEQARIEQERQAEIEKTTVPLNEEQQYNILHIYNNVGEKRVFLTFDDGPTKAVTPFILDLLKEQDIKATFFVLGSNAQYNPDLIKREYDEGHYIANHSFSHKYSQVYASIEAAFDEYYRTEQIIRDAIGNQNYRCNVFRFPGGSTGGTYSAIKKEIKASFLENGIVHLDWNALSSDAAGSYTKEQLLQNAIETIGEKQSVVLLMHDASDKILTYEMLPELIQYLRDNGYVFKTIYDLL